MVKKGLIQSTSLLLFLLGFASCSILSQSSNGPLADADLKKSSEYKLRGGITDFAKEYVGSKYKYAGKSPTGFDCSGFVFYVMKEFNIDMAASSALQEKQGKKITKQEAKPGDLVFFRRSKTSRVFHVAMVLDNDGGDITIIHSTSGRGVVIDRVESSSYWRSKIMTVRDVVSGP